MRSASRVVNPQQENAERAWNHARSRERPVNVSITVATRVISKPTSSTAGKAMIPTRFVALMAAALL